MRSWRSPALLVVAIMVGFGCSGGQTDDQHDIGGDVPPAAVPDDLPGPVEADSVIARDTARVP